MVLGLVFVLFILLIVIVFFSFRGFEKVRSKKRKRFFNLDLVFFKILYRKFIFLVFFIIFVDSSRRVELFRLIRVLSGETEI